MNEILKVNLLNKAYGNRQVVRDLSFQIHSGEILCLLGPNGAGKSTTINILCGLLNYQSGDIIWNGKKVETCLNQFKGLVGVDNAKFIINGKRGFYKSNKKPNVDILFHCFPCASDCNTWVSDRKCIWKYNYVI